ncbi:MAG: cysteine desulfurase [Verrucomicrobiota bacterium]
MTAKKSLHALRKDFPVLHQKINGHELVYFDNAATTQKPVEVIQSLVKYYKTINSNVHRGLHTLSSQATEAFENARKRAAQFIHAKNTEEIIFTRGTTESINLVAATWGYANIKSGDTILLTEMEHHSNLVPWQILAARVGAKLKFIPVDIETGLLDLSHFSQLLQSGVKLLSFTHISNTLGAINPVEEMCALAKKYGVVTLVDAAQSAGHTLIDVQKIGCDFLAFSGHKMCAPTGIGVLYGKKEILENMPPYQGGGEMIASVQLDHSEYKPAPHRFEAGTPDIAGAVGLHAAMDYLDKIGRKNIERYDHHLADYALKKMLKIPGIHIIGPKKNRAGLVSFQFPDVHAHDIVTFTDQYGVALRGGHHCNQPLMRKLKIPATARASFYFYNTKKEIDYLVDVLRKMRKYFCGT